MANRTLVAFHTKSGASKTYAEVIAETLKERGHQVDIVDLKERVPDIAGYDNIVVGTGIRMFMVYRRWKKVLKQKAIRQKNLFMFLSSGTAIKEPDEAVEKFLKPLVDKMGLRPVALVSLPGFIPEKWAQEDEEKDTVKPDLAREWASGIADRLH